MRLRDFCLTSFFLSVAAPEEEAAGGGRGEEPDEGGLSRLAAPPPPPPEFPPAPSLSRFGALAMLCRRSISSSVSSTLSSSWLMGWMCRSESEFMRTKGFGGSLRSAAAAAAAPPLPLLSEGGELAAAGGRLEAGSEACRTKAEEEAARERPATEGLAAVVAIVVAAALGGVGDSKEGARWGGGDRASVVLAPLVSEVEASFFFCSCSSTDFSLELTFMIGAGGRGGLGGLGGLFIFPSTTAGAAWFAVGAAEAGSTILDGDGGVGP